jgi:hypothetical protein
VARTVKDDKAAGAVLPVGRVAWLMPKAKWETPVSSYELMPRTVPWVLWTWACLADEVTAGLPGFDRLLLHPETYCDAG